MSVCGQVHLIRSLFQPKCSKYRLAAGTRGVDSLQRSTDPLVGLYGPSSKKGEGGENLLPLNLLPLNFPSGYAVGRACAGESVEENANLVVRLLIRRPECLGPALRGEGGGLLKGMTSSIVMSLQIVAARDQDTRVFLRAVTEMKDDDRGDYLQQTYARYFHQCTVHCGTKSLKTCGVEF